MRVAAGMLLLAPYLLGMAQCNAFAPPTTLGSRDSARLTDAPSGMVRAGITTLVPSPTTVAMDAGYRYRVTPDMEIDGAVYGAAAGKVGFGSARAGVRLRLLETALAAVSVSPGVAYGHSFVKGERSWADSVGLDYGLAGSLRLVGTARSGLDLAVGFRAQGVYGRVRYVDDESGEVAREPDSRVYLFPSAAVLVRPLPGLTLSAEATWWIQYDLRYGVWSGMAAPFVGVGIEMAPWARE